MWPNPQDTADLVTFTDEILNGKLHFLCSVLDKYIDVNWEKISVATILHFLQLILICVWNIHKTYVFIMKFQVPYLGMFPEKRQAIFYVLF